MRAILRAVLAACFLVTAAAAEGLADPRPYDTAAPAPAHHRTGFYVGAIAGWDIAQLETNAFAFSDTSLLGGAFIGAQARLENLVVGIEADYLLADLAATATPAAVTVTASTSFLASIRARAGLPLGPALLYVTAGPAFTESKLAIAGSADKEFAVGGVFGGGVEAELGKVLFLRLEGLHYIFPDQDVTTLTPAVLEQANQQTTVRLGIGFRLN
jgi:outer membrane immunogenic protein